MLQLVGKNIHNDSPIDNLCRESAIIQVYTENALRRFRLRSSIFPSDGIYDLTITDRELPSIGLDLLLSPKLEVLQYLESSHEQSMVQGEVTPKSMISLRIAELSLELIATATEDSMSLKDLTPAVVALSAAFKRGWRPLDNDCYNASKNVLKLLSYVSSEDDGEDKQALSELFVFFAVLDDRITSEVVAFLTEHLILKMSTMQSIYQWEDHMYMLDIIAGIIHQFGKISSSKLQRLESHLQTKGDAKSKQKVTSLLDPIDIFQNQQTATDVDCSLASVNTNEEWRNSWTLGT